MRTPTSTYRLQVRPGFDLHAVADACDYLATLGVGALYLSPLLPSSKGSEHGYDVIAFDGIDGPRGGTDGWTRVLAGAKSRALGIVVDIVPNHTGVARAQENAAWWDLLTRGRASRYAAWFDVDWSQDRVLLPVLGDDFEPGQLTVADGTLRYFEHRFPIAPGTEAGPGEGAADVHERQHYELAHYRRAAAEGSYRRFFAVSSLAALRVEDPAVFDATHGQIRSWVQNDGVAGLRVDHPDGLADPGGYFRDLRRLAGPRSWLVIEKILEPGEDLPGEWPVDGTTGYDALAEVTGLFVDSSAEAAFDELYRELTGDQRGFAEHVREGKLLAAREILGADLQRLADLAPDVARADEALAELLVCFEVYRSYLPVGAHHLSAAVTAAMQSRPDLAESIGALAPRLGDPADELCVRFQQTSGPVMAKGVEDTAYYRYTRFVALNEVGGDPTAFGRPPATFHERQVDRQVRRPRGMTTLATHDTKRGEDVRARLAALSELPEVWAETARTLMKAAPAPDPALGYLIWQTFAGAGLIEPDRMHAYVEKAMREAGTHTGWIDPDEAFEAAAHVVVDRAYTDPAVREPLAALVQRLVAPGWSNALSQKLVQLTMPGVPDVYQGTELWDDSLVDPDNRRQVDFEARRTLLDRLDAQPEAPSIGADGAAKLWVVSRALRLRRDWPDLFTRYEAIRARGERAQHVVAYDRGGAITVATRLPVGLASAGGWGDTTLSVGSKVTDTISGISYGPEIGVAELLGSYPVALLVR
jgi:(1->4)-alpha-D-glucan 1-alpha-D-glucosylmutase